MGVPYLYYLYLLYKLRLSSSPRVYSTRDRPFTLIISIK